MKTLVIAEKPSVARTIAEAVGAADRRDGYFEGGGYVVSYARGHLVSLSAPDRYPGWGRPWSFSQLPMIPSEWRWEPSGADGAAAQLEVLERLIARGDVGEVVIATDADREGEGIARRIMRHAGADKPARRLWSSSLVPERVREELAAARPWGEYENLAAAAEGRAKADWLVGLNGTRAVATTYGARGMRVGRVQTPTLAMLVARLRAIESFRAAAFHTVRADLGGFTAESDRYEDEDGARDALAAVLGEGRAEVMFAEYRDASAPAPRLHSLTSLQKEASDVLGMTAEETLAAAQSLYERRLATYPRTESSHITSAEAAEAAEVLRQIARPGVVGRAVAGSFDPSALDVSRTVSDRDVMGHSALMPTRLLTHGEMAALPKPERRVMLLICARLIEASMPPAAKAKATVALDCGGIPLTSSSTSVTEASWLAVADAARGALRIESEPDGEAAGDVPPGLAPGDVLEVAGASLHAGKTSPPKHYTDATLLSAMEHAGRMIEDEELSAAIDDATSHPGGLGTPATRAAVIEKIIKAGHAKRKGRSIVATPLGCAVIDAVDGSLKTPELTARWELELSRIERGEADLRGFLRGIEDYTREIVEATRRGYDPARAASASPGEAVARCPRCGKPVYHRGKSYLCSSVRLERGPDGRYGAAGGCGFRMWEEVAGKKITEGQAKRLLEGEGVRASGFTSKKGRKFDAEMRLDRETCRVSLSWGQKTPRRR